MSQQQTDQTMNIYKSPQATLALLGALIGVPLIAGIAIFSMKVPTSPTQAAKPKTEVPEAAAAPSTPAEPPVDRYRISYQGQVISDYKVGEILGEVKCGKRPVREAMDYLNAMGVPVVLMENVHTNRNSMGGYLRATTWC